MPVATKTQSQKCAGPTEVTGLAERRPADGCGVEGGWPGTVPEVEWEDLISKIGVDLEETARATKALQRRRKFADAPTLLRAVLLYAMLDWPLSQLALQLAGARMVDVSAVDLLQRLRHCTAWLGTLVHALVLPYRLARTTRAVFVRLVDASVISRPGSTGTDYRIHLGWDLSAMRCTGVEVTDAHGGETLIRHPPQPEEITVADRGYGHRSGLGALLAAQGRVVVRFTAQNLPLLREDGPPLKLLAWLRRVSTVGPGESGVQVETPSGTYGLRLIARRLSREAAEKARRRLRANARKKGHTPDSMSLEAAGFVLLLSNLAPDQWSAEQILDLYRFRWQVELVFKRAKGILNWDHLRAKEAALAQTYLLGKVLGALLIERMSNPLGPTTVDWFADVDAPVSLTTWLRCWAEAVCTVIRPLLTLAQLAAALPRLRRHVCTTPRKRVQQAAAARRLLFLRTQSDHPPSPTRPHPDLVLAYA